MRIVYDAKMDSFCEPKNKRNYLLASLKRDRAIITLSSRSRISVLQLVNLNLEDIRWSKKYIVVKNQDGTRDMVNVDAEVMIKIYDYVIKERRQLTENNALFVTSGDNPRRLSVAAVERILKRFKDVIE